MNTPREQADYSVVVAGTGSRGTTLLVQTIVAGLRRAKREPNLVALVQGRSRSKLSSLGLQVKDIPISDLDQLAAELAKKNTVVALPRGSVGPTLRWMHAALQPEIAPKPFLAVGVCTVFPRTMEGASYFIQTLDQLDARRFVSVRQFVVMRNLIDGQMRGEDLLRHKWRDGRQVLATSMHKGKHLEFIDLYRVPLEQLMEMRDGAFAAMRGCSDSRDPSLLQERNAIWWWCAEMLYRLHQAEVVPYAAIPPIAAHVITERLRANASAFGRYARLEGATHQLGT